MGKPFSYINQLRIGCRLAATFFEFISFDLSALVILMH